MHAFERAALAHQVSEIEPAAFVADYPAQRLTQARVALLGRRMHEPRSLAKAWRDTPEIERRQPKVAAAPATLNAGTVLDQPYIANIAIETDYEYYAKFNNTTAAPTTRTMPWMTG